MQLHERLRAASKRIAHAGATGVRVTVQEMIGFSALMAEAAHALDPCGCQVVGVHGETKPNHDAGPLCGRVPEL